MEEPFQSKSQRDSLKELNETQSLIVSNLCGGLLVLAPVGTGKTLAFAERATNAVSNGINPDRILCLTFTNRAAKEMAVRISRIHPQHADKITVSTFHALCANMLRQEAREIGIPSDFAVYDDVDSTELISDLARMDYKEAQQVYYSIESAKANASGSQITSAGLMRDLFEEFPEHLAQIAIEYQRSLLLRHALDFQDLEKFIWEGAKNAQYLWPNFQDLA